MDLNDYLDRMIAYHIKCRDEEDVPNGDFTYNTAFFEGMIYALKSVKKEVNGADIV